MSTRTLRMFGLVTAVALTLVLSACGDSNFERVEKTQSDSPKTSTAEPVMATAAGVAWTVPAQWSVGAKRPMRVATYFITTKTDTAECAVHYFGPGQGGDVTLNLDRWIGQFTQPDGSESSAKAQIVNRTVGAIALTTIDLTGTYTASMGGPMSGDKIARPGSRLLGAIVTAPAGLVFFKLTGSESSVSDASGDFEALIASLTRR